MSELYSYNLINKLLFILDTVLNISDTLFCVMYPSILLIGLVLFSTKIGIDTLLNPIEKQEPIQKEKEKKKERQSMDIGHRPIIWDPNGEFQTGVYFMYDKRDRTGVKLHSLFSGRLYEQHTIGGFSGYLLRNRQGNKVYTGANGQRVIKVPYLTECSIGVQATTDILSGGLPITSTQALGTTSAPVYHIQPE